MLQKIFEIVDQIKSNPIILSIVSIWGMSVFLILFKKIPLTIWIFLARNLSTNLIITSKHSIYYNFMEWVGENKINNFIRSIKLNNGRWGGNEKHVIGLGYGTHFIIYKFNILKIKLVKEEGSYTNTDNEILYVYKLGRNHDLFNELIQEFASYNNDLEEKTKMYKYDGGWCFIKNQYKRKFDSIFLEESKKKYLLDSLRNFKESEEWYKTNGIPYHLGILLFGEPGTGKTSIIKAIASEFNKSIYILSTSNMSNLLNASSYLPPNSILVIEDVDSSISVHKREISEKEKLKSIETPSSNFLEKIVKIGLSDILNAIDGLLECHGRIIIMTTNKKDILDPAFLRPGRVDIKIEIGFVNEEIFKQFLNKFFSEKKQYIDVTKFKIKERIPFVELQQSLLERLSFEEIVKKFIKK